MELLPQHCIICRPSNAYINPSFYVENLNAINILTMFYDSLNEIKVPSGTVVVTHLFVKKY